MANIQYMSAANDVVDVGASGGDVKLYAINVSTATATAVVTVYNGNSTSDPVVDVIDAASKGTSHYYGALFPNGLYVKQTTAGAKVSVIYG